MQNKLSSSKVAVRQVEKQTKRQKDIYCFAHCCLGYNNSMMNRNQDYVYLNPV